MCGFENPQEKVLYLRGTYYLLYYMSVVALDRRIWVEIVVLDR